MRIVVWNCCGGFDRKVEHLLSLQPDVAVLCEVADAVAWPAGARRVSMTTSQPWPDVSRRLGVLAREPYELRDRHQAPAWLLAVDVDGPAPFTLVGTWTLRMPGAPGYERQLEAMLDWVEEADLPRPLVVAGDFNAPMPERSAWWERLLERARALGLVDATAAALESPAEPVTAQPTYYHLRKADRPFHIDHVLVPSGWATTAAVTGTYEEWVASGLSDHVPVTVETAPREP